MKGWGTPDVIPLPDPQGPATNHAFGEPAVAASPKADLVFDKFEFGLSLVPAAHKPAIDALADRIAAIAQQVPGPLGTVRLVGHTDFIDTEKYNQALGLLRAKAVRGALATALEARLRGVTSRIEIVPESRGELQPATKDASPAGRELNRRVEVFLALKFAGRRGSGCRTSGCPGPSDRPPAVPAGPLADLHHEGPAAELREAVRGRGAVPPAAAGLALQSRPSRRNSTRGSASSRRSAPRICATT